MSEDAPESPVSALQEFARRAKNTLQSIARALRRATLFREALQLERFQNELGRVVALFMDDTKKIRIDPPPEPEPEPENNEPPVGQTDEEP